MSDVESYTKFETVMDGTDIPQDPRIEELRRWCRIFADKNLAPHEGAYSAGNMSFRVEEGKDALIITASGTDFGGELKPDRFVTVHECSPGNKMVCATGANKPSSEAMMHHALYKFYRERGEDVNWIFHGHSDPMLEHAKELGLPMTTKFVEFGTYELVESVLEIADQGMLLMLNKHGFICMGPTSEEAGNRVLNMYEKLQSL